MATSQALGSKDMAYSLDPLTGTMTAPTTYHSLNHRQSLPVLQTRASYPESYDAYSASPIDGYPYLTYSAPRNDSMGSAYETGYRSWSGASLIPPASAQNAYEQSSGYTFGSISAPSFTTQAQQQQTLQPHTSRLPNVMAEGFSSLNMGHLYTSLPTQTVQNRRLPIPNTAPSYELPPYSGPELPEIRLLAEPRTRLSSAHSRIGVSWPGESDYYTSARNGSSISLAPPIGPALQPTHRTSVVQDPVVGYHYSTNDAMPATQSPTSSPTIGPSSSSATCAGGPSYSNAMTPLSYGSYYGLPPITTTQHPGAKTARTLNNPATTTSSATYAFASSDSTSSSERGNSDASAGSSANTYASYPTIQHPQPQPQHAASAETLRGQASFDHQQPPPPQYPQHSAGLSQRISVSDLSGSGGGGGQAYSGV